MRALYRVIKMFHILIWVLVLWVFTIVKTYQGTSCDRQRAWWTMDGGSWQVQETGIKTIPKKKKCRKAKWLSEEALQIDEKRREVKGKGKKERYSHLNAEFQRTERRDKKVFLSEQCKETEKNNWMGKTRDLFKKIRDTKGTFHTKMGTIKDRNGLDLTEAEILRRGGKNTQKNCTKNIFTTQIITMVWSLT